MNSFIVTIGREFGTGGRQIANKLGEILGVKVYDKRLLDDFKQRYNLTTEEMDRIRANKKSWWNDFVKYYQLSRLESGNPAHDIEETEITSEVLYNEEKRILEELVAQESCVVLGRTGFHIFRDYPNAFKVFLIADKPFRRDKVARRLNINEGSADLLINKVDEARETFTKTFSDRSRYDARNYDLVVNITGLEPEEIARFIADCVHRRLKK